jgi:predicted DNA-binding WGR domain protein
MLRFEFRDGGSSKFWEAGVEGAVLTIRFGRIGTEGQSKSKALASVEAARKEYDKLVREKTGKGYALVAGGEASFAASPEKPTAPARAVANTPAPRGAKASAPSDAFALLGASPWRSEDDGGEAPPDEPTAWAQLQRELGPSRSTG